MAYLIAMLTLILLMWRIWRAPNNASKWQIGFNSAFKGLTLHHHPVLKGNVFMLTCVTVHLCNLCFLTFK